MSVSNRKLETKKYPYFFSYNIVLGKFLGLGCEIFVCVCVCGGYVGRGVCFVFETSRNLCEQEIILL